LLPLVPLAALVVGDFRERRIGVWWLGALGACTVVVAIVHNPAEPAGALHNFLFNFGLMAGLAMALLLYFAVRRGLMGGLRTGRFGTAGSCAPERRQAPTSRQSAPRPRHLTGGQTPPLREQIGLGDPLFFLALTPLFAPRTFLMLVIACLAISLVWWLFNRGKTIPLVGTSGSVVAAYLIYGVMHGNLINGAI